MIVELGRMPRALVFQAARALDRARRGVALLDGDGWGGTFLAADPIEGRTIDASDAAFAEMVTLLDETSRPAADPRQRVGWAGRAPAPRWIGYVAYEAARALERPAWTRGGGIDDRAPPIGRATVLRRYDAIARRDADAGVVAIEGTDAAAIERLAAALRDARAMNDVEETPSIELAPAEPDARHRARIEAVLSLIARGDLYQANVARAWCGRTDAGAVALLEGMLRRASARFAAAIDFGDHHVASTSPELFLRYRPSILGARVLTSPIKGTRPRGLDSAQDAANAVALAMDPKERAELTMIVDLERSDLGRVARLGSVRADEEPRIESSRTVHHRVCDVRAVLRSEVSVGGAFEAMFPSGSVTGAPKVRAMEVIATLEDDRRGVYCGSIVALDAAGGATASIAIRTVIVDRNSGEACYHAGGGIVADSDPAREVSETEWKARQVAPK